MKTPVILIVDDEEAITTSLRGSLEDEGYIVLTASSGNKGIEIIQSQPVDVVLLDIWLPGMDGLETLKAIKDFDTSIDVVMMTGHGTVNTAVQAVKQGAFDFLEKPFSLDVVLDIIKKLKEKQQVYGAFMPAAEETSPTDASHLNLLGSHPDISKIRDMIPKLAADLKPVLIQGEIGTGKEIVAQLIHANSPLSEGPFVKFNCAFYSPDDIEREIFGEKKSRKSGGQSGGVLNSVSSGTVFLYGIDACSEKIKNRLSRYIDENRSKECRIIAASLRQMDDRDSQRNSDESFVKHFPHRLSMLSLRRRRRDIPLMLDHFKKSFCDDYGMREKIFDDETIETLINYDWPGNVKELKNLVEKLVVSVPTKNISAHDIPMSVRDEMQYNIGRYYERYTSMEDAEAAWRKNYLLYYLRKNDRDIRKTAAKLSIKEKSLRKYIKEFGIVLTTEKKKTRKFQRTLKRSMVLSGRGLHSGDKTGLILTPLPPNSGIYFGNISSGETVPADIDYIMSTGYATCLQNAGATAKTIEHFLAVLHAYRITNLMIKINNEVPIMDGSSIDFCQFIEDAGIEEQEEPLEEITVSERFSIGEMNKRKKFITIEPSDTLSIHYTLNYPKPVGHQEYTFTMDDTEAFKKEIAPARTFAFLKDIESLEKKGLAGGGRLNNFILIDDEKIVNTDLRFPDEFVRHKILDMMGDFYLLGKPVRAKITANMTGHTENTELVRKLRAKMHV